jgi:hypothetical protein
MDGSIPEKIYVAALLKDLEMALPQVWGAGSVCFWRWSPVFYLARHWVKF